MIKLACKRKSTESIYNIVKVAGIFMVWEKDIKGSSGTIMPAVMASWLRDTSLPRSDFGASSALYTGTTVLRTLHNNNYKGDKDSGLKLLNTCQNENFYTQIWLLTPLQFLPLSCQELSSYNVTPRITHCMPWSVIGHINSIALTRQSMLSFGIQHLL